MISDDLSQWNLFIDKILNPTGVDQVGADMAAVSAYFTSKAGDELLPIISKETF